jgi:plastocyanin
MTHTTKSSHLISLVVGALALAGCPEPTNTQDVPGSDATDAVNTVDTGNGGDDVTTDTIDVSQGDAEDTGEADTGPSDSGPTDTGPADTGPTPLNGCATFTDLSAPSADRTILFPAFAYTPNCIEVAAGQMVTWNGTFMFHPLRPGRAPSRPATDTPSSDSTPIIATDSGTTASFTFATPGDYGFYCNVHQSSGMYGVVRVH